MILEQRRKFVLAAHQKAADELDAHLAKELEAAEKVRDEGAMLIRA